MTDEFKEKALIELRKSFLFAREEELFRIAFILWDLIPKIYNGNANDQKHIM